MKPTEHEAPSAKYRRDYQPPHYWVERVDLRFELEPHRTLVGARLEIHRDAAAPEDAPLLLDGEGLELLALSLDGAPLAPLEEGASTGYVHASDQLRVEGVPERFVLESKVAIDPQNNTELSGLYRSSGVFCTQCEAEGFRRITFHLDRPDVMSMYSTTIVADPELCPVMLSNGNKVDEGKLDDGRAWVKWEDPFKKPSYLFALVAGKLSSHAGTFQTRSGREVALEIWVEPQNLDKCEHALRSLQHSMKWDEEVFGLEYDLDVYMIVAVNDFNMGAMENKGLNVFNSKYVLARPETATDDDYEHVEGVIAHEYFHNWTGNRVTCRDWFQLTLKEGLTVFRDQQFTADMTSAAVKRISDVRLLRTVQFEEDAGPMAHPIRPESYIAMDNFYTATVYIKGAEVIRMYHTLLGAEGFRKGMDLYFERHDGHAVTCDDFRAAMADANGKDLTQFERWYDQPGTPTVKVATVYDAEARTFTLTLAQSRADMKGHAAFRPTLMPVTVALLAPSGQPIPLKLDGASDAPTERVLELTEAEQSFTFRGVSERPVPSVLRGFSAPVRLEMERSPEDLAFLFAHDDDAFNRWDAGQALAERVILDLESGRVDSVDPAFVEAWGQMLEDAQLDGSLKSLAMSLPPERALAQKLEPWDPERLHAAREKVIDALARAHEDKLVAIHAELAVAKPYAVEKADIDGRRLKNAALAYLCQLGDAHLPKAEAQLDGADNMTDAQAAFSILSDAGGEWSKRAREKLYPEWKKDPLVLDKWFATQASAQADGTLDRVLELREHPDFTLSNPNRARSLVSALSMNPTAFHAADGRGYAFLGAQVEALHDKNPQIAARLVSALNGWRRLEPNRQALMRAELERLAKIEGLSKDVFEIVERALDA